VLSGIGIVVLAITAALSQLAFRKSAPWLLAAAGSVALAAGMLLIVLATGVNSSVCYLAGSVVGGVGFGVAFVGGLTALVVAIPPERRAAVMSAFYVVAYVSLSVPAVLAGTVVGHLGLQRTFETFGIAVSAIALLVAALAWKTRPTGANQPQEP
jgi:predicted MFS family arabinose efflux permease